MYCQIIGTQCNRPANPEKCGGCYHASSAAYGCYQAAREQIGRDRVAGVVLDPEGNDFSVRSGESAPVESELKFSIIGEPKEYEGEGLKTILAPRSWGFGRKRFPILIQGKIRGGQIDLTNYAP